LQDYLVLKEYGQIDCGTRHGETGWHNLNSGGEAAGVYEMAKLVVSTYPKAAIVIEDFILDFKKADKTRELLSPVRLTAAFSYEVWKQEPVIGAGLNRISIQDRSNIKTTCTDERLKNWGLYDRNSGQHARDAMRHAYYYLRQRRGNTNTEKERRYFAWPHLFPDPAIAPSVRKGNKIRKVGERIPGL
jgi:hypothetical protein